MHILIFGRVGQVGQELLRCAWPQDISLSVFDRDEVDLSQPGGAGQMIQDLTPDLVINATAYTAVDKAEEEEAIARAINATAPGEMAQACHALGIPMFHISTDYVFDGTKQGAYSEADPVAPLGAYGRTKEEGERLVREALDQHIILRTAWVYAAHGNNFVKTMLRVGAERDDLRVVEDQVGSPTWAGAIAEALHGLTLRFRETGDLAWGTYHFGGAGQASWHAFACAVFDRAEAAWGRKPAVAAIPSSEYPLPAARPANSVLDCTLFDKTFGLPRRPWGEDLDTVVTELLEPQETAS